MKALSQTFVLLCFVGTAASKEDGVNSEAEQRKTSHRC